MLDRDDLLQRLAPLPNTGSFVLTCRCQTLPGGIDIDRVDPPGVGRKPQRLSDRLRNRLGDDPDTRSEPAADSKPASAPTGNRRQKPPKAGADTTDQTATN